MFFTFPKSFRMQACIPSMLAGDNITRGNAVVNQVASLSYLVALMLGSVFYAMFGLRPVMYASVVFFFATALFECFIELPHERHIENGSMAAGLLTGKMKMRKLALILAVLGVFMVPAGIAFLLPIGAAGIYAIHIGAFCGMQIAVSIFSIFAVSFIQQRTPDHLIRKVMAYTSAITLCIQPIGQIVYGFLFDRFRGAAYLILIPTGMIVCAIGLLTTGFFKNMEREGFS